MVEFNPDGSIKIPGSIAANLERKELKLKKERCVLIKKELADINPKKCVLHVKVSSAFPDSAFVSNLFRSFQENSDTPSKLVKINEREFDVVIGSDFKRCTDCNRLVSMFREFLEGNIIEEKGSCTQKERSFAYEDYFE